MIYKMKLLLFWAVTFIILLYSCKNNTKSSEKNTADSTSPIPVINYSVTGFFPHDTTLFTEGFLVYNGELFESTGSPEELAQTKSLIGVIDLSTGKIDKKIELDKKYFGEGIVFLNNKLYQLTYKNQIGFIYDAKSFKQIGTFNYLNAEGWSLTTDGINLIMSDGTANLTFINPDNLKPVRTIAVTENGTALKEVNELEYIKGFIYANVYRTNDVVKIDPSNGKVVGKLDLNSLALEAKYKNPNSDVMNGIAYDSLSDKIYVTGKLWSNIYQINFPH
jgi:glutaminyl-peptide cyclotransferase